MGWYLNLESDGLPVHFDVVVAVDALVVDVKPLRLRLCALGGVVAKLELPICVPIARLGVKVRLGNVIVGNMEPVLLASAVLLFPLVQQVIIESPWLELFPLDYLLDFGRLLS